MGSSQQVERTVRRQLRDVFISHSSADRATATEIHDALVSDGQKVWFDDSEIQIGVLLSRELQEALRACRVLILSWSEAAAASRWVNFEWIAAHHLHRFILPIMLDGAQLPQCFEQTVRINLALDREAALRGLSKAVRAAKAGANPLPPPIRSESPELTKTIREIANGQKAVTDALGLNDLGKAAKAQAALDAAMPPALTQWPLDPMIVKLDGYHIKNDYMVRHWQAVQSGRGPDDPALEKADRRGSTRPTRRGWTGWAASCFCAATFTPLNSSSNTPSSRPNAADLGTKRRNRISPWWVASCSPTQLRDDPAKVDREARPVRLFYEICVDSEEASGIREARVGVQGTDLATLRAEYLPGSPDPIGGGRAEWSKVHYEIGGHLSSISRTSLQGIWSRRPSGGS
jgi:TIR domain